MKKLVALLMSLCLLFGVALAETAEITLPSGLTLDDYKAKLDEVMQQMTPELTYQWTSAASEDPVGTVHAAMISDGTLPMVQLLEQDGKLTMMSTLYVGTMTDENATAFLTLACCTTTPLLMIAGTDMEAAVEKTIVDIPTALSQQMDGTFGYSLYGQPALFDIAPVEENSEYYTFNLIISLE